MKPEGAKSWRGLRGLVVLLLLANVRVWGQAPSETHAGRVIVVSIADRKLAVIEHGHVLKVFTVAVGADVNPSPAGGFRIVSLVANPGYYHPGIIVPPGKDNPLGPRWIGLSKKGYGIHGTNQPESIGKAASHGCIRLRNRDIRELFAMVTIGDTVEIRNQPDQLTAQIFVGDTGISVSEVVTVNEAASGGQR